MAKKPQRHIPEIYIVELEYSEDDYSLGLNPINIREARMLNIASLKS